MTSSPEALEALARAYDREDASQRGEPDPWDYDDGNDAEREWRAERIACAQVGLTAYLASSPEGRQEAAVSPQQPMTMAEAAKATEHMELPDDLRLPLHSLQADLAWLFARVAGDGSMASMCEDSARNRLSQIEEACYRILFSSALIPAKPAVEVVEALRKLANEVGGLIAFEPEVRQAIGHTNWNVLQRRLAEADTLLTGLAALQAPATPDAQTEVEK